MIEVVFSADEAGARPLIAAIRSIATHLLPVDRVRITVLHDESAENLPRQLAGLSTPGMSVQFRAISNPFVPLKMKGAQPPASMLRLFIPEVLSEARRVIYLDIDVIVLTSLGSLFELDMGSAAACGVLDYPTLLTHAAERRKGVDRLENHFRFTLDLAEAPPRYVNTGVLVMDLDKLRKCDFTKHALAYWAERNEQFIWNDQDVINGVLGGRICLLDPRYNVIPNIRRRPDLLGDHPWIGDIKLQLAEPWILHFAGRKKPWHPDADVPLRSVWLSFGGH
jgi:lipopolysaccharide biosynthesis glycosyltransferase